MFGRQGLHAKQWLHAKFVSPRYSQYRGVVNEHGGKQSSSPYRADLIPSRAALAVAKVLKQGADKYGAENWRKIHVRDHINHAMVHLLAYLAGDAQDDHLDHAACRILFALEQEITLFN